jgi:quinol monooxygenase YgiN
MVVVHSRLVLSGAGRALFDSMVGALIAGSRAEPGCISYRLYESRETPGEVIFVEEWASRQSLDEHFTTPHFTTFVNAVAGITAEPGQLRIFEVSSVSDG